MWELPVPHLLMLKCAQLTLRPKNILALGSLTVRARQPQAGHDGGFLSPAARREPGDSSGVRCGLTSRCQPLCSFVVLVKLSTLSLTFLVCKMETLIPASSGIGVVEKESVYKTPSHVSDSRRDENPSCSSILIYRHEDPRRLVPCFHNFFLFKIYFF